MKSFQKLFYILFVFFICFHQCCSISLEEFVTLNLQQKRSLDSFRERVVTIVPHEYMKKDVYLIRFLRDANFDVRSAEENLLKHLEWRKKEKMDTILSEDWVRLDSELKLYIQGCDKEGRPVVTMPVGEWEIRNHIVSGSLKKVVRYGYKLVEEAAACVRKMLESGQNVTQLSFIFDLRSFSVVQNACPNCIVWLFSLLSTLHNQYPEYAHQVYAINTPEAAVPIIKVFLSAVPKKLQDLVQVYGRNKMEWQKALQKDIDPSQLSYEMGGIKEEATDFDDLRRRNETYKCQ